MPKFYHVLNSGREWLKSLGMPSIPITVHYLEEYFLRVMFYRTNIRFGPLYLF